MSKRAALIITEAPSINWRKLTEYGHLYGRLEVSTPTEQLLEDLMRLTYKGTPYHIQEPARLRVRALLGLPEDGDA